VSKEVPTRKVATSFLFFKKQTCYNKKMEIKGKKNIASGTVHKIPPDFKAVIIADKKILTLWEDITPLARNEWICWVTSGKKEETRNIRIRKALSKMRGGMRRPCCWAGCPHR
jgi:uncharacterized protein YdeI (YjbR/CyaY-like superfamily)